MGKMKLESMIRIGFGATFLLMIGIGVVSWVTVKKLKETNYWVSHTHKVIGNLRWLEKSMVDTETGQRGFIIVDQETFLEPYIQGQEDVKSLLEEIQDLTRDNPIQQENLDVLQQLIDIELKQLDEVIQLKRNGNEKELTARFAAGEGKQKMDEIRAAITDMIRVEEKLLTDRNSMMEEISRFATLVSVGGTGSAIILGVLVLLFISREVIQPINRVASQISSSSSEIAVTVEQQEQTTRNQAAIANQTSTTMDELGASSRQSAEQAEDAASGAQAALILSEGGTRAVMRTREGMETLRDKVAVIAAQILHLSEQTNQIGSISDLVSDLANQTNMLALNAAVEAVRVGEHGRGFAVVSGEIRKLADQSKISAEKINVLVHDIQAAINATVIATDEGTKTVEEGVRVVEETSQAFSGVTDSVNNIAVNNQQISLNAQQQAMAIQQILTAMKNLNQATQETTSGIGQVKEGTHHLNDAAMQLKLIV
jgi:methyl-accepting chemotaxis protein